MKTEILTIQNTDDVKAIKKAAKLLDQGRLVAFPTETVYGVGCSVRRDVIDRLNTLKGRSPEKHYTLHVGSREQITTYLPSMSLRAAKLVKQGLPGPMTVIFGLDSQAIDQIRKTYSKEVFDLLCRDQSLGIRYPDNPVATAILSTAQSPIVAPSANPAGLPPATTAQDVMDYFDGQIDFIIDAPAMNCVYKKSSTVVKVSPRDIKILREGAISLEQIRQWATVRILFVCTGNTCRSPMAEGCCKKYFSDILGCQVDELADFGYIIESAGIAAFENSPAANNAVKVCREQQIDLRDYRSRQLTRQDVEQSDLILAMSHSHRDQIVQMLPSAAEKCLMLDGSSDIPDPVGLDLAVYQACFHQIKDAVVNTMNGIL